MVLNKILPLFIIIILIPGLLLFYGCEKKVDNPLSHTRQYIFLSHTYDWHGNGDKVDSRIEKINYNQFDQIWLGGDICRETSARKSTLSYLEDLFKISAESTKWAIGNHDFRSSNLQDIREATHRPLHYSSHSYGITYLVMNSYMEHDLFKDSCQYKEEQVHLFQSVMDSIESSTHLVILMHNVLWADVYPDLEKSANQAANAEASWMDMTCDNQSKFRQVYYPRLLEIQNNGIQVVIISGDGGQYRKKFYHKSTTGIEFYISGINNSFDHTNPDLLSRFNTNPDSVLIFTHNLKEKSLVGEFMELNELVME